MVITDLNQLYLDKGMLRISDMGRGYGLIQEPISICTIMEVFSDPFRNDRGFKSPVMKRLLLKQDGSIKKFDFKARREL